MESKPFRQIGKGFCGSVGAPDCEGPAVAMKRKDGGPERSIKKDSTMHIQIERSLRYAQSTLGLALQVCIPQHHALITVDNDEWWSCRASRFPSGYQHCNTLLTERILPLRAEARENLIEIFCLEEAKDSVRQNRKDEDCLVRPYLGRRTHNSTPSRFFTLRNKPLKIDQMISINLPIEDYARAMSETLAVIYWHSKADANDIEFVLAPGRADDGVFQSEVLGQHSLWILDFDCVNVFTHEEAGVERAASAYMRNDPFWPRPGSEFQPDQRMWDAFRNRFLVASRLILGRENELPQLFIDCVERLGQDRRKHILTLHGEAER